MEIFMRQFIKFCFPKGAGTLTIVYKHTKHCCPQLFIQKSPRKVPVSRAPVVTVTAWNGLQNKKNFLQRNVLCYSLSIHPELSLLVRTDVIDFISLWGYISRLQETKSVLLLCYGSACDSTFHGKWVPACLDIFQSVEHRWLYKLSAINLQTLLWNQLLQSWNISWKFARESQIPMTMS